jgi:hypothetical protein
MNSGPSNEETFVSFLSVLVINFKLSVSTGGAAWESMLLVHHAMKLLAKHELLIKPLQTRGKIIRNDLKLCQNL